MFDVRLATDADRPEIEALIAEMIPGCDVAARWRWLYATNPGGPALTWIASEGGKVAGCTSFFPFRMWLDGAIVRGALGGDGYVRPEFRRRGLGGLLHDASRQAMPEHGIGCMYGAPGALNLTPLKHGGSREVGHVSRWARPLRGSAIKLDALDGLVAVALKPRRTGKLEAMAPLDDRLEAVWAGARQSLRLAAVRDASFYTWRFLAAPAGREPPFVIVRRGKPIGACALEAMHGGKTLRIVDLIAIPGEWHACLRAIARHATDETSAHTLDIKLFTLDGRKRGMWRSGFTERDSKPFLCMIPKGGDRRFVDPDRWFYCGADSDLDSLT
ncbi:MAG: GNAT family N-acetyltransferase [Deltaproteobacteria bacterium]|nr:GNAT family N-acetyltransferase [Deltaproteobacteria bacterium]